MITIVHVTESFGGGVASVIQDYVKNTPEYLHQLVFADRSDAPVTERDLKGFSSSVRLPNGHLRRIRFLRDHIRQYESVIVHVHSSIAGVYVRTAVRKSRMRAIVYTPHCFAFERTSSPALVRISVLAVESALSLNTSAYAACSQREQSLAKRISGKRAVTFVPNAPPDLSEYFALRSESSEGREPLRIIGAGRLAAQKDPAFFRLSVKALRSVYPDIEASWIGGGPQHEVDLFEGAGIKVTGWLPRADALKALQGADVYLHSAAWEGFPVAVLEADSLVPMVVARNIPSLREAGLPNLLAEPSDAVRVITALRDTEARASHQRRMRDALSVYSQKDQQRSLRMLYGGLVSRVAHTLPQR
jgi:glycosyltransferase involved in cell wall biosynthesis